MSRVHLRLLLPIVHTVIDVALLATLVVLAYREAAQLEPPTVWKQNYAPTNWGLGEVLVAQPFQAISIGTLPVSIICSVIFPNWFMSSPFDFRWVGLHLALGIGFWWAVGRFAESATRWRVVLLSYVAYRILFFPVSLGLFRSGWSEVRDGIAIIAWSVALLFGLFMIATWIRKRSADSNLTRQRH